MDMSCYPLIFLFFPLETAEYAHLFSGCWFFSKLQEKVLYFAIQNLFPVFLSFIAIGSPAQFVLHQASIAKQQRTAIFPPQSAARYFYLSTPNSRRFSFITRFFIEVHARKTLFCRSFSLSPPVKRTQKGRPVLRPAALASGVRFLENYISLMAACAAARRAIGTRKGEQET